MTTTEKTKPIYLNIRYALIQSLYWMAYCSILGFPMIFFVEKGFSYTQIGIITATVSLVSALVQPYFPPILQHFNKLSVRKLLIILILIATLVGVLLLFLPAVFLLYLIAFILISVSQTAASALMNSLAMEYLNAGVAIDFGTTRGIGSAAYAIVALLIGKLLTVFGVWVLIVLDIAFLILLTLVLVFMKGPDHYQSNLEKIEHPSLSFEDSHPSPSIHIYLKRNPVIIPFLISSAIVFISSALMGTSMAPNYLSRFHGTSSDSGTVVFVSALSELPMMALFAWLSRRFRVSRLLIVSALGFIIKAVGSMLAPSISAFTILQVTQGLGYGLFTVASVLFINSVSSFSDRVMGQGLLFSMNSIGCTIGNFFGGQLLDSIGLSGVMISCVSSALVGGGVLIYACLLAEKRIPDKLKIKA